VGGNFEFAAISRYISEMVQDNVKGNTECKIICDLSTVAISDNIQ